MVVGGDVVGGSGVLLHVLITRSSSVPNPRELPIQRTAILEMLLTDYM